MKFFIMIKFGIVKVKFHQRQLNNFRVNKRYTSLPGLLTVINTKVLITKLLTTIFGYFYIYIYIGTIDQNLSREKINAPGHGKAKTGSRRNF